MNREKANKAINNGAIAGCISGFLTLAIALFAIFSNSQTGSIAYFNDPSLFFDVAIIFVLAYGIYKKSRTAAVILFIYFLLSKVIISVDTGNTASVGTGLIFLYFYGNAIRGTFNYHKIEKAENPDYKVRKAIPIAGGVFAVILAIAVGFYLLGELGVTPSSNILAGNQVKPEIRDLLQENGILYEQENIELFYSEGITSVLEGGSLLTDRAVIVYTLNEEGELDIYELAFDEIQTIQLDHQGNFADLSIYKVYGVEEGVWLGLYLPTNNGQDVAFVEALRRKIRQ